MFNAIPLMIIPFILYNMSMLGLMGGGGLPSLENDVIVLSMISGAMWSMLKVPDEHTIQKVVSNYLRRGGNPNVAKPTSNEGKLLYG